MNTMNDDIKPSDEKDEVIVEEVEQEADSNTTSGDDVVFDDEAELGTAELIKKLRTKLKTAVEEKQQYLTGWQKDKAEFVNARKRDEESKQDFLKFAKASVIEDILPVLDSFDMAMANKASWESVSKEWRAGVEGIYQQLTGILQKHAATAFGAIGDVFDPSIHHSIGMVQADDKAQDHTVAEVMQKGYKVSGKVVRPALVKVFEA